MKNLYMVSSCIRPTVSRLTAYSEVERLHQTIKTIHSIRSFDPNSEIILYDSSATNLSDTYVDDLRGLADHFCHTGANELVAKLSSEGFKSCAECISTYLLLDFFIRKTLNYNSYGRIFKVSGRYFLNDAFDLSLHIGKNAHGKYVFKKSKPTWMSPVITSRFFETRLYSFCPSLFDEYVGVLHKVYGHMCDSGLDIEHALYDLLPKENILELDIVGVEGLAGPGTTIQTYLDSQTFSVMDDGNIKLFD
jgi:hypothetical protein